MNHHDTTTTTTPRTTVEWAPKHTTITEELAVITGAALSIALVIALAIAAII